MLVELGRQAPTRADAGLTCLTERCRAAEERRCRSPQPKAFPVSWDQFHRDARALAWRLAGGGAVRGHRLHHPRRPRAGGDRRRASSASALIETVCVASYHDYTYQGELQVLKDIAPDDRRRSAAAGGKGVLVVDDLVDTGKTARIVRDMLPNAHFATVYAKPLGRPLVDTFVTEVSARTPGSTFPGTWASPIQAPIAEGHKG